MRKSFKDSLKALQADIQHANTLASEYPREYDGGCLKMRLSYSRRARIFLFLVQWSSNCYLAGALGFLRVLVYKAYEDGKTSISVHERRASIRNFYGVIFPSLLQLQRGISDVEDEKQRKICSANYRKIDEMNNGNNNIFETDLDREDEECGICMEVSSRVVLPNCYHCLCINCYKNWRGRSLSCPFCRDSLKRVNSGDLWVLVSKSDIEETSSIAKENLKRLVVYIEKLPLVVPDPRLISYDPRFR